MPVNTRIQLRRGTAAAGANQWVDQVLAAGEVGFESDSGKFKIGDGTTAWNSLGYASVLPSELNELVDDRVNALLVAGSNISLTYDDNANTLTIATDGLDTEQVEDIIGTKVQGGDGISVSYNDTSGVTTISLSDPSIQLADITDLDADIKTFLITPSSDNLRAAIDTSTTGSGALVFNTDPVFPNEVTVQGTLTVNSISGNASPLGISGDGDDVTISSGYQDGTVSIGGNSENVDILGQLKINSVNVTSNAAELNLLDGASSTTTTANNAVIYGNDAAVKANSLTSSGDLNLNSELTNGYINLNTTQVNLNSVVVTSSDVTIGGNLIVNGTTTTVNSTVVTIDDPIFTLGGDTAPSSNDSKDRGIEYRWYNGGMSAPKIGFFGWSLATNKFTFIPDATNTNETFTGTKGEIDANVDWSNILNKPDPVVTVTLEGDVTGTANTTLTDLASGTVTVSTTIAANSVALGTDTTGNYVAAVAAGSYATVSGSGSENAAVTVGVDATSANTASKVVARDASGNFSAGTITADLTGTATNALNVEVDSSSSNINHLVFVNGTNGNLKPSVNSNLRFDAVNNELLGDDSTTATTKLKYFVIDGGTP